MRCTVGRHPSSKTQDHALKLVGDSNLQKAHPEMNP